MVWEVQRHDWSALRADRVPEALYALARATNEQEGAAARGIIESTVAVEGALYAAAVPTTACLLAVLQRCSSAARPHVLEILVELGSGEPAPSEVMAGRQGLQEACREELSKGLSIFLSVLEIGTEKERMYCIDLIGLCCQREPAFGPRVVWYFEKLLTEPVSESLKDMVQTWLRAVRALKVSTPGAQGSRGSRGPF